MGQEREKKFLVKSDAWRRDAFGEYIHQGYLSTDKHRTVRVRIKGKGKAQEGILTIKGLKVGDTAPEYEYSIPLKDARELLKKLSLDYPIEKTRYKIKHGGVVWEVDEFHGKNKGLVLAEVELAPRQKLKGKPEWAGKEVTRDPRYFNSYLSNRPFTTWATKGNKNL